MFGYVVFPTIAAAIDVYLLFELSTVAIALGVGWLIVGIIYLAIRTRGFRMKSPAFQSETTNPEP